MDNLLLTTLIIAGLVYFYYQQNQPNNQPITDTKSTQTTNPDDQALERTIDELIKQIKQLNQQLK
jgi:hypothetical protein